MSSARDVKGFLKICKKDGFYCNLIQYYYRAEENCKYCKYNMKGNCIRNLGIWYVR